MRILLLGKEGQVGWELRRSLAPLGEVVALGSRELDLARPDLVREAVRAVRPETIVCAAAYTAVDRAESEPDVADAVNGRAPGILADEANRLRAALVHYSTDYVFDGVKREPYTEDDPTGPLNVYGRTKLAGEDAVREAGGGYLILRTSWVYGLRRESFVTKVLGWARTRRTLRVVEDQVGSPTWCRSLAEATAGILARGGGDPRAFLEERAGVYHLAGGGATSRYEWACEIVALDPRPEEQLVEEVLTARSDEFATPARRPAFSALDCGRAARVFGVELAPWRESLAQALAGAAPSGPDPGTSEPEQRPAPAGVP